MLSVTVTLTPCNGTHASANPFLMVYEGRGWCNSHFFYLYKGDFVTSFPLRGCLESSFPLYFPWLDMKAESGAKLLIVTWEKVQPTQRKEIMKGLCYLWEPCQAQSITMGPGCQSWHTPALGLAWVGEVLAWKMMPASSGQPGLPLGDSVCFQGWHQPGGGDESWILYLFFPLGMGLFYLGTRFIGDLLAWSPLCV